VLEGVARGGELLWVEGQGSLLHPAYSGVTLGLVHGSRAARLRPLPPGGQTVVDGDPRFPIPPLRELVGLHERLALIPRPARVAAIALNTRGLDDAGARAAIAAAEAETGLAADDPVRFGAERLTEIVLESIAETVRTVKSCRRARASGRDEGT
jgi:uncharacterized NAD-dependent epimerase/dehydratase family protein